MGVRSTRAGLCVRVSLVAAFPLAADSHLGLLPLRALLPLRPAPTYDAAACPPPCANRYTLPARGGASVLNVASLWSVCNVRILDRATSQTCSGSATASRCACAFHWRGMVPFSSMACFGSVIGVCLGRPLRPDGQCFVCLFVCLCVCLIVRLRALFVRRRRSIQRSATKRRTSPLPLTNARFPLITTDSHLLTARSHYDRSN